MGRWADGAVLLVPPSFQINALPTLQAHVDVSELFDPKGAVGAGSGARGKWREALLAATRGVTDEEPVVFGNASVVCAVHEYFKIDPETWNAWLWVLLRHPDSVSTRDGGAEGAGRCGWGVGGSARAVSLSTHPHTHTLMYSCVCVCLLACVLVCICKQVLVLPTRPYDTIVRKHLRQKALAAGIAGARVRFLPRFVSRGAYLSALRGCDVMVDTPEFNAQTTAADVLWAAVPLVGVCVCARAMASLRACVCSSIGTDVL